MAMKRVLRRGDPIPAARPGCGAVVGEYLTQLSTSVTAVIPGNGTLYLSPVVFERETHIDQLAVNVTVIGSAGSVVRLGAYVDDPDNPGTPDLTADPLFDLGTVSTESTGLRGITLNWYPVGRFWLAAVQQGTPATRATYSMHTPGATQVRPAGAFTTLAGGARYKTGITGALAALTSLSAIDNANCLTVGARVAA